MATMVALLLLLSFLSMVESRQLTNFIEENLKFFKNGGLAPSQPTTIQMDQNDSENAQNNLELGLDAIEGNSRE